MILNMQLIASVIILGFISVPVFSQQIHRRQARQNCITPENYYGRCVALSYCPQAANVFQATDSQTAYRYVLALQRSCGTRSVNGDPLVCCTRPLASPVTQRPNPLLPTESTFVQQTTQFELRNPFLATQQSTIVTTRPTTEAPNVLPITAAPSTILSLIDTQVRNCKSPDLQTGVCIEIKSCQALTDELLARQTDVTFKKYLQASNRICGGTGSIVCCPVSHSASVPTTTTSRLPLTSANTDEIHRRLPTIAEGCGYTLNSYRRIVGGEVSKKGAWPWIALLGYDEGFSELSFKCGGTLITARHVITAAHCIRNDLTIVRLGEHDLSTDKEAQHVDVPVAHYEARADYNRKNGRNDIAIIYLDRDIKFTEFITPICLPTSQKLRQMSYVNYMPFVVGWGKTMEGGQSANVLNELQIPIFSNDVCRKSYARKNLYFSADQFDEAVLCAGVLGGGKDTCQGDSGGPLMIPESHQNKFYFYLIGIVSYGVGCARPDAPGVYTSVQYFMDWIEEKIRNTP